jgi:hypothetical protein
MVTFDDMTYFQFALDKNLNNAALASDISDTFYTQGATQIAPGMDLGTTMVRA